MASIVTEIVPPGNEQPFSAEERYALRKLIRTFGDVSPDDLVEIKRLAHSGRFTRTLLIVVGKILLYAAGAASAFVTIRQLLKGGN